MPFAAAIELASLDGTNGFEIMGGTNTGNKVTNVGDVNGDGYDDVMVAGAGDVRVVFGSASHPADFNVTTLDGSNGFRVLRIDGETLGAKLGGVIDLNGDGFDDLVFTAVKAQSSGEEKGVYVIFGHAGPFAGEVDAAALDGSNGFKVAPSPADNLGYSIASVGDVNGDGVDDLMILADEYGQNPGGGPFVLYGDTDGFPGLVTPQADGVHGFRFVNVNLDEAVGFTSMAGGGDFNGDGIDDIILSAVGRRLEGALVGAAYVVFGQAGGPGATFDLTTLDGANGFVISGPDSSRSGRSVSSAGDMNGDGVDDILIGADWSSVGGNRAGSAFVVFGRTDGFPADLELAALDGTDGFRMDGAGVVSYTGDKVAGLGDVNGDGFDDIIIGSRQFDSGGLSNNGAAFVVFGRDGGFAPTLDLTSLNGANGFRLDGIVNFQRAGASVSAAGDVNGDGVADILVGAAQAPVVSYIIYGIVDPVIYAGTAGDDVRAGTTKGDSLSGQDGKDVLRGLAGDDSLDGGVGADELYGGEGADDLVGGTGADLLDGGTGADEMAGGTGDDTFIVDDAGDVATEAGGEGADVVRATVTVTLGANIETLVLEGVGDIGGTGNGGANTLNGNIGNNALSGGGGADLIKGGAGDDVLDGGTGADQLLGGDGTDSLDGADDNDRLEGGAGNDTILGGTGGDLLDGGADNDSLTGGTGADQLFGGIGTDALDGGSENDLLNGGVGADAMTGGSGDDTFYVDDAGDTTIEALGEGTDTVRATVTATLAANVERMILDGGADIGGTGNALANVMTGNAGANTLNGGDGADLINGGLGSDVLNGDAGADNLTGGDGNDTLDGGADNDALTGGIGIDSLTGGTGADLLDGGADNDTLVGNAGADTLNGGEGVDTLDGGDANDVLNGGAGADAMTGGAGDDTFHVNDGGDTTVEALGEGTDTVRASVSWTLGASIERIILEGAAAINGTGNGLANVMTGNGGNNVLDGGAGADNINGADGDDRIIGGTGDDFLRGGMGADVFVVTHTFAGGLETDQVLDFGAGEGDIIDLSGIDAIAGGADDAFTLVGAFTHAAGQMTLSVAGGITTLKLDVNGDGAADYQMKINGDVTAESGDWLL